MNEPNPIVIADRYEVVGILGEGGMGVVYKAHDRLLDSAVAIKMMREMDAASTSKMMLRFQQEAKAAGRLNHSNVARVMDFGQLSGKLYMVMELLDGTPLSQRIDERERLSVDEALPLFIDICQGLVHAHKMGVLHRDLKPSNIILTTGDGIENAKIVDFGIAKLAQSQDLTATGAQMGSPLYMSPEQVKGIEADSRSDIYSMGCLMYEVLSGKVPIKEETALETMHKKTVDPAPTLAQANSDVPQELVEIVDRCLMISPDDRYKQMTDLLKALTDCQESIARNQELFAPVEEKHEEPTTNRSSKMVLLLSLGLLTLLIPSVTTWWLASRSDWKPEPVKGHLGSPEAEELHTELQKLKQGEPFKIIPCPDAVGTVNVQVNPAVENVDKRFKELQTRKVRILCMDRLSDATGSGLQFINKDCLHQLQIDNTQFKSENTLLVGQFHNLEYLSMHNINIENRDFVHLETLKKLKMLDFGGFDNLDDETFNVIENFKSLTCLGIADYPKFGTESASVIAALPKLEVLSITRTPLSAATIKVIGSSQTLNILDLCVFDTAAENMEALSQVKHAEHLKLRDVELNPEQMMILAKKPNLKALTIGGGSVVPTAPLIRSIKQMKSLWFLEFAHCWMESAALKAIAELPQVTTLSFMETHARDNDSLKYLMNMPALERIRAGKDCFSQTELNRFARNYSRKWKRTLDLAVQ